MKKTIFILLLLAPVLSFSQNLKSGGVLKPEQAIMDIKHYTVAMDVNPETQTIDAWTEIELILSKETSLLLFDFWHGLTIKNILVNNKKQAFTHSDDDLIKISLNQPLQPGRIKVKISYAGKPGVAKRAPWDGGFQWDKDSKGNHWIAMTCQGEGAKIFFPCKDHPSDEPDEGADMLITVPKGLVVAGPGLLESVKTKADKSTYHWKTNYTISNYCILFNAGNYKVAKRIYTTVDGNKVPMEYYVLEENFDKAEKLLDLFEQSTHILEKYFGEYPWVKERMALCETPHLGMEHQTNIAYGNKYKYEKLGDKDFDWLLHHEFGHEWWANKVTNKDWAHMWIQEGICSFGDALATKELAGEEAYLLKMRNTAATLTGKIPVVRGEQVDSDSAYKGPIYGKGAFFMHSLNYLLGDNVFFPILKKLATDEKYTYNHFVTTDDVEQLFSKESGKNLKPFFDFYLRTIDKLEFKVVYRAGDKYKITLSNLNMGLPIDITTDKGTTRMSVLPGQGVTVDSKTPPLIDPKGYYLKRVVYE
jgi:aminopeptidase N